MDDIVRFYGFKPNRAGFIHCPFHTDKTASLKVYTDGFYCYGCGASGSVIDFVMQLFNLSAIDAAKRINDDMRLGLPVDGEPDPKASAELQKAKKAKEIYEPLLDALKAELCAIIYRANTAEQNMVSLDDLSEGDAAAIRYRERAEYLLDLLNNGSEDDVIFVVRERKGVHKVAEQIS